MGVIYKMVNKKGQQMTLGTIIAIVLGIAVLVFLIFGFSTGWGNLWDRVTSFGGTSNVDTIVQACALRCSTGDKYSFCTETQTLKFGSERDVLGEEVDDVRDVVQAKSATESCDTLANDGTYSDLNIAKCPSISCN